MDELRLERKHSGLIRAMFFQSYLTPRFERMGLVPDEIIEPFRLYTNMDAGAVYRRLRARNPQYDDTYLQVAVIHETEFIWNRDDPSRDDRKMVAAKRIDTSVWRVDDGQHPYEFVAWKGELPSTDFIARSGPISLNGGRECKPQTLDKAREVMDIFAADRMDWQ